MNDEVLPKYQARSWAQPRPRCPIARSCDQNTQHVIVRLPDDTRAVVTFTGLRSRKGRGTSWFWTPVSAVVLDGAKGPAASVARQAPCHATSVGGACLSGNVRLRRSRRLPYEEYRCSGQSAGASKRLSNRDDEVKVSPFVAAQIDATFNSPNPPYENRAVSVS